MMSQHTRTSAQAESWELLSPGAVPANGTFYGIQRDAPYPSLPHPEWGLAVYRVTTSNSVYYVYDDCAVDYELWEASQSRSFSGLDETEPPMGPDYAEGDFWIEIFGVDNAQDFATLGLHNVQPGLYGQILIRTNIEDQAWKPGPYMPNEAPTNLLVFQVVATHGLSNQFYRGVQGFPLVQIVPNGGFPEAIEPASSAPNSQRTVGVFDIILTPAPTNDLTVFLQISGSAVNGIDYTNLSGSVTSILSGSVMIPEGFDTWKIYIDPYYDTLVEFDESVTLSLILTNGYVVHPDYASASLWIKDYLTNCFQTVVTNLTEPIGIDYHQPSNSLILSVNRDSMPTDNFVRVYTNGGLTVVTNWSGIAGVLEEVKLATPKQMLNSFTNGDVYFGSGDKIGLLTADGTRSNLTWGVLSNEFVANAHHLHGGLYVDQSGTFSNHLIAVTGDNAYNSPVPQGVWRVNGQGQPTLLTEIATPHLEGVITLTNDVSKWGPWAGKVLTGDEATRTIYAIDPNGAVVPFDLGIHPEDFDIITTNQDLYCVNFHDGGPSWLLKLPRQCLTNYVGDLLITQAGELGFGDPTLFIVSWKGTKFEVRRLLLPAAIGGAFEHVTFAPLELPPF